MKRVVYLLLFLFFVLVAFKSAPRFFTIPKGWEKPAYDFKKNKLTQEKINIGRALFYDNILSKDNTVSCSSCHLSYTGFTHVDHDLSHGIYGRIGKRNAPALMNLAWRKNFMIDGAVNHLDMQALAPMSDSMEMDENINHVLEKLNNSPLYKELYYKAFDDSIITTEKTLKCISQFMLTLVSANSKYDRVMSKKETFSAQEKNGYSLFQKNCAVCHQEPLFTTNEFETNGLKVDPTLNDFGRMKITHNADDSLKFRIPSLRNIEYTYPYMHDGRFKKLMDVLNHYTTKIQPYKNLPVALQKPIVLSIEEKKDIIAFLLTLSDREFVTNPKFQYPKEILNAAKE